MEYVSQQQVEPSSASKRIALAFIDTMTSPSQLRIPRSMFCAGCRAFNPSEHCDQLGIDRPPAAACLAFRMLQVI